MWPRQSRRGLYLTALAAGLLVLVLPIVGVGALLLLVEPASAPDSYVEAVAGDPPLLNPVLAPFTLAGQDVVPLVFAGLVRADAAGNVEPDLAESVETEGDGSAYLVHLRDGLVWDDGAPLTADDVAFTIQLVQAPDHQGSQELAELWRGVEVEVIDSKTVRFRLPSPLASFPEHLTLGLLPKHILDGTSASDLPLHPFNRQPVGSGPYRVISFNPDRLVLERNPGYAGAPAKLARVEIRPYAERAAAFAALRDGTVDGMADLQPDELRQVATNPDLAVYSFPERSKVAELVMNLDVSPLGDVAVRRALAHLVDRDALVRGSLAGQGEPAFDPIPVQSWAFSPSAGAVAFDPLAAATTLDTAGWPIGPDGTRQHEGTPLRLELVSADTPERTTVAQALADELRTAGIDLQLRAVPIDELLDDVLEPRQFQLALAGEWAMGSDPDVYPRWHSSQIGHAGGNYAGFNDADVDHWLEAGRQEQDRAARRNAYLHFQARWAEEQPGIMLYHPVSSFALARDVRGVAADPVPDSSWRLRGAVNWYRVAEPTGWQKARAFVVARASWFAGW
jgi:peptide/nickel transport system substrate-binding protein